MVPHASQVVDWKTPDRGKAAWSLHVGRFYIGEKSTIRRVIKIEKGGQVIRYQNTSHYREGQIGCIRRVKLGRWNAWVRREWVPDPLCEWARKLKPGVFREILIPPARDPGPYPMVEIVDVNPRVLVMRVKTNGDMRTEHIHWHRLCGRRIRHFVTDISDHPGQL